MAQSSISILVQAKDRASATIGKLTGSISTTVGKMAQQVQQALTTASVALGALGVGLTTYAKDSLQYTQDLVGQVKSLQRQTGLTTEQGSRLIYVMQRMGVTAEASTTIFNTFSKQIDKAKGPLKDLNIKTKNADKSQRDFHEILLDVADRFAEMPDGVGKTRIALQLFGRQGPSMVRMLNQGSKGIEEMEKQADKLGITITEKTAQSIADFSQSQRELKESTSGLKVQVGLLTAPVLTNFNRALLDMTTQVLAADTPLQKAIVNFIAFGGPVATGAGALVGFLANISTVSKGLGTFITVILGVITALVGSGGLIVALSRFLGLNFEPLKKSLGGLFSAFVKASNDGVSNLEKFAQSPAWKAVREKGNDIIVRLAESIDRVTKALNDGGLSAGIQQIGTEFEKVDVQSIVVTLINKLASFPWDQHADKMMQGMLNLINAFAARTAEFVAQATPALLQISVGIIDGLIRGLLTYATQNPVDFILLFVSLGFAPARVVKALGTVLSKIPIIGPMLNWIIQSVSSIANLITGPVKNMFKKVGSNVVGGIKEGFTATIGGFKVILGNAWQAIKNGAKAAWEWVKKIDWGGALKGAGKGIANGIIGMIEGVINSALKKLPGSPQIKIPRFYKGVRNFSGGLAVVGDINGRGGELVNLPRGTDVYSNQESKEMLGGKSVTINGGLHIHNNVDYNTLLSDIGWRLMTAS